MKKQVATFLMSFLCVKTLVLGFGLEINTSYDYFRGLPDGSWNGNSGALIGANSSLCLYETVAVQLGGSYGIYNWDGRGNVVFANPKRVQEIGFVTAGLSSSFCNWNGGLVYDRLFANHFSIFALSPSIDQIRFQVGYNFCSDELGIWGTHSLKTDHKLALGLPVSFKAIGQMNLFWSHFFENCAQTTLWIGMPYENSLMYSHQKAGNFIAGFSFKAPLTQQLYLEGNGSYMVARNAPGAIQSRNYISNLCLGLTYCFGDVDLCCECYESPYMPIANHSNFFVDINTNQ